MYGIKDQVVLITGASSGFGEDAAKLFAAEGCKVVLTARRMDRLQALAGQIQEAGGEAVVIPMDITHLEDIDRAVRFTMERYGRIDILFNNAGMGRLGWLEEHDPARDLETLIRVNLIGLMQITHAVLPHMIQRRSGHILNMASVAGWIAPPLITAYSASKYGVRAFTDALRREVMPFGVRVSGIYPGPASTEFGRHIGKSTAYQSVRSKFHVHMTSEYVARQVIKLARHPRRRLIIPWWFNILILIETVLPILVDWVSYRFSKSHHRLS